MNFEVRTIENIDALGILLRDVEIGKFNLWFKDVSNTEDFLINDLKEHQSNLKIWGVRNETRWLGVLVYQALDWDTEFFGMDCGQVRYFFVAKSESPQTRAETATLLIQELERHLLHSNQDFCSISIDSMDSVVSLAAQKLGFQYIVSRLECSNTTGAKASLGAGYSIRTLEEKDLRHAVELSHQYFKGGRFYLDPGFSNKKADLLYEHLVRNSFNDPNCEMLTLYRGNTPVSILIVQKKTYHFKTEHVVKSLRLLIYDQKKREPGLASAFLGAATNRILETCNMVLSGIEFHNAPSVAIHIKNNYIFNNCYNVYHWWKK